MGDSMVEEFFAEVEDKYYPQILEGIELLEGGDLPAGVEILSRPLHTIKGVTGFMSGYEFASTFTHRVEDFLKLIQSGEAPGTENNIRLLSEGVNMLFSVLETIRDTGEPDRQETDELLGRIEAASGEEDSGPAASVECLTTEKRDGITLVRITAHRLHLPPMRDELAGVLALACGQGPVLVDFAGCITVNSATFEMLAGFALVGDLTLSGLEGPARGMFHFWNFDSKLVLVESAEEYFAIRGEQREVRSQ